MSVELWVEKWRPKTIADYVWRDAEQKAKVEEWISSGALPNLLFSGRPGTGKTSLAELLLHELKIPSGDILKLNASRERRIDDIQDKIQNFVSTWALGPSEIKYVLLDEADSLSPLSQRMLRSDLETYSGSCRFIFTVNYPEKIIEALHSRTQGFHFKTLDPSDFVSRAGEILMAENVEFEVETLLEYTDASYPDLRKCINTLQQGTKDGKLSTLTVETTYADYLTDMVDLFKKGSYLQARQLIVSQARPEEYPDIFRFLYSNLDLWGDEDQALLIIRNGLVNHALVADPEINLAATLCELTLIRKENV